MFAVQFEVEKLIEARNGLLFTKQQNWKQMRTIQSSHTLYKKKRSCRRPSCFSFCLLSFLLFSIILILILSYIFLHTTQNSRLCNDCRWDQKMAKWCLRTYPAGSYTEFGITNCISGSLMGTYTSK